MVSAMKAKLIVLPKRDLNYKLKPVQTTIVKKGLNFSGP